MALLEEAPFLFGLNYRAELRLNGSARDPLIGKKRASVLESFDVAILEER
jgi:hypothetical protein